MMVVAQAELAEQHEQVHLADAELDVLPARRRRPLEQAVGAAVVVALGGRVHAALVDEPAEVGRDRHVGRGGDDPVADTVDVGQAGEDSPEGLLGRRRAGGDRIACRGRDGQGRGGDGGGFVVDRRRRRARSSRPAGESGSKRSHSVSTSSPTAVAEVVDLLGGQQRRMVHRVAGDRQTLSLDRVGEHDRRPVGDRVARPERVEQHAEVVAAEIGDQPA